MTKPYTLTCTLDEFTNSQMWGGHGHSHEDNLVACLLICVTPYKDMTLDAFIDEAISFNEWDIVDDEYEGLTELVSDVELEDILLDELSEDINKDDVFDWFYEDNPDLLIPDPDTGELPDPDVYQYGWIHIYKDDEAIMEYLDELVDEFCEEYDCESEATGYENYPHEDGGRASREYFITGLVDSKARGVNVVVGGWFYLDLRSNPSASCLLGMRINGETVGDCEAIQSWYDFDEELWDELIWDSY